MESLQFRILGSAAIAFVGFQIVRRFLPWIYVNIIGPKFLGPKVDLRRMGSWALITGATDGIGKAYAKAMAKRGLNVVLVSRSPSKLEHVAREIRDQYHVDVKMIDVDFSEGPEIYDKIRKQIDGMDIGVLINNVGMSYNYPEYFLDYVQSNPTFLRDIISVNIHSVTYMTNLILPAMVKRRKGVIINISSTAAIIPNPLLSVYSASKAFVNKFSVDMQTEYSQSGIIIQSVQPGFVVSNMSKIRKPTLNAPSADTFVESALRNLGYSSQTAGYFAHTLMQVVLDFMATIAGENFTRGFVLQNLLSMRKKALRNLAKKQ